MKGDIYISSLDSHLSRVVCDSARDEHPLMHRNRRMIHNSDYCIFNTYFDILLLIIITPAMLRGTKRKNLSFYEY